MDLFHNFLDLSWNFILQIVKRSVAYIPRIVATWKAAIPGKFDQLKDAGSNKLQSAAQHAWSRGRQAQILVAIHANGKNTSLGSSGDGAIAGEATTTEYHIRSLFDHRPGSLGAPLWIDKSLIIVAVINHSHFGAGACQAVCMSSTSLIALT